MFISVECRSRAYDAIIDISLIVKDSAASGAAAYKLDVEGRGTQEMEVHFDPGVLIASYDDAGNVGVEEEDGGVRRSALEEKVLDGEVEVGIQGAGDVDLRGGGGFGCMVGEGGVPSKA